MTDEQLNERIAAAAREHNDPPPVPRDRMWERIAAARRTALAPGDQRRSPRPPAQWRRWIWPGAAAAAMLVGLVVGRSIAPGPRPAKDLAASGTPVAAPAAARAEIFGAAATPVLGRAEILLTQFRVGRTDDADGRTFADRARSLLSDTRLLIASPAAADRDLRRLLSDLEVTLVQIVRIAGPEAVEDRQWALDGLDRRSLLPRLRTHSPTFALTEAL